MKNKAAYSHIDGAKIVVRYAQKRGYRVESPNTSIAPQMAVALYATSSSLVNSLLSRSWRSSSRPPPAPVAGRCRSSVVSHEERSLLRKVDRHGAAHFREQLGCDFPPSLAAGPVFYALHHHPPDERRNPLHALARRVGPHERRREVVAVRDRPRGLDQGLVARRVVRTRRIGREHVARQGEGSRPATAAQRAVFADATLAAERPLAELPEQGRRPPDVGKALGAQ